MSSAPALRVLVVGVAATPSPFLSRLFDGLRARGLEVRLAPTRAPGVARAALTRAAQLTRLAPAGSGDEVARARAARRVWRPDVVYMPWNSSATEHRGLIDGQVPVVVSCRGSQIGVAVHDPDRPGHADQVRATLTAADLVHCVSDDMAASVVGLGVDPASIRVIRPAVDLDLFTPPRSREERPDGELRVASVGALIWRKGGEDLLVAFRGLLDAGVAARLEIIGSGPERARLAFTLRDLGLEGRAELVGDLSPSAVAERLRSADVFALPSLSEGISNAVLEAMACGLATVTTDVGGHREAVTSGVDGWLVPSRDPGALTEALVRLAADVDLRSQLGRAGRRKVEADHSLQDQVAAFAALLADAADRSGAWAPSTRRDDR